MGVKYAINMCRRLLKRYQAFFYDCAFFSTKNHVEAFTELSLPLDGLRDSELQALLVKLGLPAVCMFLLLFLCCVVPVSFSVLLS